MTNVECSKIFKANSLFVEVIVNIPCKIEFECKNHGGSVENPPKSI